MFEYEGLGNFVKIFFAKVKAFYIIGKIFD